ncbi:hypothetical protein SYN63AY4M2_10540 [Synechococcus sp. 63AY4M2]|nr:hypothetical protein SYN63AY4M2_10540 [Synechococcus sp. 63AY4M2]PIK89633.1 hypothetical protein SYN65AY6A5_00800 [Synechococcus sp. 65AY6A5]PIK93202.1 hypothetical protein SYN65AY6LI_08035 [Synechococcus sp. 65AY6Li]PIK96513.1 hypothetical protein SYN60AY4M2_11160 [Synechococcus sp. 60AY4M2]PIK99115.1 hypothetical protein SYN63AY4M1_08580 [Synechococcus sp. 63AY4M1]PIL02445.1 hypothetical protein SYN65AY640_05510 [Synechococcus sp. 65AY640]
MHSSNSKATQRAFPCPLLRVDLAAGREPVGSLQQQGGK